MFIVYCLLHGVVSSGEWLWCFSTYNPLSLIRHLFIKLHSQHVFCPSTQVLMLLNFLPHGRNKTSPLITGEQEGTLRARMHNYYISHIVGPSCMSKTKVHEQTERDERTRMHKQMLCGCTDQMDGVVSEREETALRLETVGRLSGSTICPGVSAHRSTLSSVNTV